MSETLTLHSAVLALVRSHTTFLWGDGEAPTITEKPYGILYTMPHPPGVGSMGDPHILEWMLWQFTLVGETQEQALWASDQVRQTLIGRTNGDYTNTIATVIGREPTSVGGCIRSSDNIYYVNDTYRLLVDG